MGTRSPPKNPTILNACTTTRVICENARRPIDRAACQKTKREWRITRVGLEVVEMVRGLGTPRVPESAVFFGDLVIEGPVVVEDADEE